MGEGLYQNARYEDLRPVAREYISRCHQRVSRHLPPEGRLFLDAGSGPIQYPEYLDSEDFVDEVTELLWRFVYREDRSQRRGRSSASS